MKELPRHGLHKYSPGLCNKVDVQQKDTEKFYQRLSIPRKKATYINGHNREQKRVISVHGIAIVT